MKGRLNGRRRKKKKKKHKKRSQDWVSLFFWVGPPSHLRNVFSFACQIKLICNQAVTLVCQIKLNRQSRFNAGYKMLGAGALGWPRGMVWEGKWEEGSGLGTRSDFTFTFHFHALEKEMATHSSVLAWRIPGKGKPGGLPSLGSHRVRLKWLSSSSSSSTPVADSCWCMAKPIQYCKVISL